MEPLTLRLSHAVEPSGRREPPALTVSPLADGRLQLLWGAPGDRMSCVAVVDAAEFCEFAGRAAHLAGRVCRTAWDNLQAFNTTARNGTGDRS